MSFRLTKTILCALVCLTTINCFSQGAPVTFTSSKAVYELKYAPVWEKLQASGNIELALAAPKTKNDIRIAAPIIQVTVIKLSKGYENISVRELAGIEEKMTKAQDFGKAKVVFHQSDFKNIHGREWWIFEYTLELRSVKTRTKIYKTITNATTYAVSYSNDESSFSNYDESFVDVVNSFNFLGNNSASTGTPSPASSMSPPINDLANIDTFIRQAPTKTAAPALEKDNKPMPEIDTTHKPYTYTYFAEDYENNGQYMLLGKVPPGATVGIIDFDAGNAFTVKTKMQKKVVDDCEGERTYTTIANPPPPLLSTRYQNLADLENGVRGMIAIINFKNLPISFLKTVPVTEKNILQNLHDKLIKSGEFKKFAAGEKNMGLDTAYSNAVRRGTPVVNEVEVEGMVVRLVEYEVGITPRFIEVNGKIFLLSSYGIHQNQKGTFYKYGNNYFLHFGGGTGFTENVIYEIRPNGIKKECFFEEEC